MSTSWSSKDVGAKTHHSDVVLICPPFLDWKLPSIGLSLLKQTVANMNITAELLYFNILFAKRIGVDLYNSIIDLPHHLFALEWIFSQELIEDNLSESFYINKIVKRKDSPDDKTAIRLSRKSAHKILMVRKAVPAFLKECVKIITDLRPRLVGFSLHYQQRSASLSMAKLFKQALPGIVIIFGGADCLGIMGKEIIKNFPYVDAAISGEGESVFPEIVRRVFQNKSLFGIDGVSVKGGTDLKQVCINDPSVRALATEKMDDLPFPVYDDYYKQLEASGIAASWNKRMVPFETSRGCWWGEKKQCRFCGFIPEQIAYRTKSTQRVIKELKWIADRYKPTLIVMVDSILNPSHFE